MATRDLFYARASLGIARSADEAKDVEICPI
jgi:hypothetical protein